MNKQKRNSIKFWTSTGGKLNVAAKEIQQRVVANPISQPLNALEGAIVLLFGKPDVHEHEVRGGVDVWKQIGADAAADSAQEAVEVAAKLVGLQIPPG